jgi:cephalosporin hydroxylase
MAFDPARDPVGSTPATPLPVPDELKLAAIEAVWHQQGWREATWLGHPVCRYPTDLHSYQELVSLVRPDAVVIVADDAGLGGRALFAASLLDQLGRGRVLAVGRPPDGFRPVHPRILHVDAPGASPDAAAAVVEEVGEGAALVLLGLGATDRVIAAFEAYSPLVPVGGYVVVENTVLNGRPAASSFGPGPHEAVNALLQAHRDFVPDVAFERYTVTFNKNGYLRRTGA